MQILKNIGLGILFILALAAIGAFALYSISCGFAPGSCVFK